MSDSTPITYAVTVSGLAPDTPQSTLEHFFSFCGKISSIAQEGGVAKVSFIKESAAKTALMLNGGTLAGSQITVTSEDTETPALAHISPKDTTHVQTHSEKEGHDVEQEDKPRSAVAAEYLAHGYLLSDQAIEKAIATDKQYGISSRFLSFFSPIAAKVQSTAQPTLDRAATKIAEVDANQGFSLKLSAANIIGAKYYQSALASPFGAKVHKFYTDSSKQVIDVHEEALRIKEAKKADSAPTSSIGTASTVDVNAPAQTTSAPLTATV